MGFDNECILNIQSLPGEYFCPVCRTLVYPKEALQAQCTHLYCKPCLAYVVATTHACPYDGYLVTEADAKPLIESNKPIAEAIDKIQVHCLYHRSGCQWQGPLSECTTHCAGCSFGNSPVVCNRCGTQIIHRQVQEHGQTCPGVQPQAQQVEVGQPLASSEQSQAAQTVMPTSQDASSQTAAVNTAGAAAPASSAPAAVPGAAVAVPSSSGQDQSQVLAQSQTVLQAPTAEQWYQQQQLQYQQYYQQFPGYDPYQLQYQQYGQYPQQAHPQYPQPHMQANVQHVVQGQQHPHPYAQPQSHLHPQPQPHPNPQPQPQAQMHPPPQGQVPVQQQAPSQPVVQLQPQMQPQPHQHNQPSPMQAPINVQQQQLHAPSQQLHPLMQPQTHPPQPANVPAQLHPQLHAPQGQPLPQAQLPQHQQPAPQQQHLHPQMQHPQVQPQPHAYPQPQLQSQYPHMQPQPQAQGQLHVQPQPQHPSAHAVTGHQSYPQPLPHQQMPLGALQQRPVHLHPHQQGVPSQLPQQPVQIQSQFPPQQPPQMRPPQSQIPAQVQQQANMLPPQGPHSNARPTQQQAQHLVHQQGQQMYQQPGMQVVAQQQGLTQQQAHGQMHPSSIPPQARQHPVHPQQSLRPQGPSTMQQYPPSQPHLQQNIPPQGMSTYQSHSATSRPMLPNQGIPQQPFQPSPGGPAKLLQASASLSSPNQSYSARTSMCPQGPEQQLPSVQQSQLPHSANQVTAPLAASKATLTDKQGDFASDRTSQATEVEVKAARQSAEVAEGAEATGFESAEAKFEGDNKPRRDEEKKPIGDSEEKSIHSDIDDEDSLASGHLLGKDPQTHSKEDDSKEPGVKLVEEGKTEHSSIGAERNEEQHDKKSSEEGKVTAGQVEDEDKSLRMHQDSSNLEMSQPLPDGTGIVQSAGAFSDRPIQNSLSLGLVPENDRGSTQGPLQQQPSRQNIAPGYDRAFPQTGLHEKSLPQYPHQGPIPGEFRGMPPVQSQSKVMGHPAHGQQLMPFGPPQNFQDAAHQRPPFQQQVPHIGPNADRRFQESAHHQMQGKMRPPGHSFPESLPPHQGQSSVVPEPFGPPMMKQPPGSLHSDGPLGGFPGPGLSPSLGRGSGNFGPPQKSFESPAMAPQANLQGLIPPSHAVGALPGPPLRGPPPGAFDAPGTMRARGPANAPDSQMGWPHPPNSMDAEMLGNKMPGFYDARQPEPHQPPPGAHSDMMRTNGFPGKGPTSFIHRGPTEDRFRPSTGEGFKAEDQFRPFQLDPTGRRPADRREFEEDLKQFPRPGHLDVDGVPKFGNHLLASRPLDRDVHAFGLDAAGRSFDRASHGFGRDGVSQSDVGASALQSRSMPPYQSSGSLPASSGGPSLHPMGIGERQRRHDDNFGRKMDPSVAYPEFNRPASEFGRHHLDGPPPLRSPGREYIGFPPSRYGSMGEEITGRESMFGERSKFNLSSDAGGNEFQEGRSSSMYFRRGEFDGVSNIRMGDRTGTGNLPGHVRSGDLDGQNVFPSHLRGGDPLGPGLRSHLRVGEPTGLGSFHSHSRMGEAAGLGALPSHLRIRESVGGGSLPSHMRIGEPGFSSSFSMHSFPTELGSFNRVHGEFGTLDNPRKRKPGSMGWCRICKIDCETVEGLDLHSQTKEHQKMAMDIVLTIKQDNAKKQKLSSDDHVSLDEANKSRKATFESRGNRN